MTKHEALWPSSIAVMTALIGSCYEHFAIRRDVAGEYHYLVRGVEVPRQVFLDAFEIARADRFDPDDPAFQKAVMRGGSAENEDEGEEDTTFDIH